MKILISKANWALGPMCAWQGHPSTGPNGVFVCSPQPCEKKMGPNDLLGCKPPGQKSDHIFSTLGNEQKWVPPPRFAIEFYMGMTPFGPTKTQQKIHKGQPCAWNCLSLSWWIKWHQILGQIVGGKPQDLLLRCWSIIESCQGGVPHLFSIIGQHLKSKP